MNNQSPVNGHPNPFTLEQLSDQDIPQPLSVADVAHIRALQEAAVDQRRAVAHRAAGNRGDGAVKKSRDGAQYVRQQRGHSFIMEWLVLGIFTLWIRPIYLAASPNHYFHL
jgi:hypothetical protein